MSDATIADAPDETWLAVDAALRNGTRGLPGGSSLASLLSERRGVRNKKGLPRPTTETLLAWADAHHARTGAWPNLKSGPIAESPGETWNRVQNALVQGGRGLPMGGSLAQFLAQHRGVRNDKRLPNLSQREILAWADSYFRRTGQWPTPQSGSIPESPGESWGGIHKALQRGRRGISGANSLVKLLQRNGRGVE